MKKSSFLLGGALLLAALFTTSCKEMMGSLDNPVKPYLELAESSAIITPTEEFSFEIQSINDQSPIYTFISSNENVAVAEGYVENGKQYCKVTGVGDGEATITVSVDANAYYLGQSEKFTVKVQSPLTFEALEDATIWPDNYNVLAEPLYYSIDGGDKIKYEGTGVVLKKGQKAQFESANDHLNNGDWNRGLRFWPTGKCAIYGNVMSLITPDGDFNANKKITKHSALYGLFSGDGGWYFDGSNWYYAEYSNSNILSHEQYKLLLPAATLTEACYATMFKYCPNIKVAPELPATTLADNCYESMFENNTSLIEAPDLPAKTLANYCYNSMFRGCSKLEKAPELPAENLANGCYSCMFAYCSKLEKAPALPAMNLASYCYNFMFGNCQSLTEAPELKATNLVDNCYNSMFSNCENLAKVICLAENNATDALGYWLSGAGTSVTTRTLKKAAANNNWELHDAWHYPWGGEPKWYVPTGWTIANAE